MIYSVQNELTGETLIISEYQRNQMLESAPDDLCREKLEELTPMLATGLVNVEGFYFICYLAARAWLGIRGVNQNNN